MTDDMDGHPHGHYSFSWFVHDECMATVRCAVEAETTLTGIGMAMVAVCGGL